MPTQETITIISADQTTQLEAKWLPPARESGHVAVLAHHYPPQSNMDQRASFATYKVLRDRGWGVLRYNSRGVGKSAGEFSGGAGEILDLAGAIAEVKRRAPHSPLSLIGWSFGAELVLKRMANDPDIVAVVAVTPNPRGILENAQGVHAPFLAIVAERDQYFDPFETRSAFEQASEPKAWHFLKWADHFYVNRDDEVAIATVDWLEQNMAQPTPIRKG